MTNFYCLKWGTKYNRLYVNRLFKSLKKHYNNSFNFTCLTDNSTGIHPDIKIENIPDDFSEFPRTQIFTSEKMCYFNRYKHIAGPKAWFDLDILIQNNITELIKDSGGINSPLMIDVRNNILKDVFKRSLKIEDKSGKKLFKEGISKG